MTYSGYVARATAPTETLTDKQKEFVKFILKGRNPEQAARAAGYSSPNVQGYELIRKPNVQNALRHLYKKHEMVADISRKKVMDGLLEAIEIAKIQADAQNMVAGWREIGRMCGYYAPEVKKIEVNVTAKRVISQLETLSDEDLLKMVEDNAKIIEGEATHLLEDLQKESDEAFAAEKASAEPSAAGE